MKFTEKWLREWVNPCINSNILFEQITHSGIEIESVINFKPQFTGVLVGKIITCISHGKNYKLKIIQVDIGLEKLLKIVCRASNCRVGIKVAVAVIGSVLLDKVLISKRVVQGEYSEGMLCSFLDLGLFETDTIIEFHKKEVIGENINKILFLQEKIFKVNITPNRPDGLSILGLSRDIAVLNKLSTPILKYKKNDIGTEEKILLDIKHDTQCLYFSGRIIKNININIETPFWMKKKLFHCDLLSKNIITDIINYVLIEIGQPIQAIDADKISGNIVVQMADQYNNSFLKDGIVCNLTEDILIFKDNQKIISIPGNINSDNVDLDNNSQNIFLHVYFLNREVILNTMKKFTKNKMLEYYSFGIDPILQDQALEYATSLIISICGGTAGPIVQKKSINSVQHLERIRLYIKNIHNLIGTVIDDQLIFEILSGLNYQIFPCRKYIELIPPSWRSDIIIEEDVIGDILRIYGYNKIDLIPLQEKIILKHKKCLQDEVLEKIGLILINKGYYEVVTYSFIDPKIHHLMFPKVSPLLLSNPISQEMSCMRFSLWPGLLKTISYNQNHNITTSMRFFESGLCFALDKHDSFGIKQELFLSAIISGNFLPENWHSSTRKVDFYDIKGDLECLLESIFSFNSIEFRKNYISGLHPEQSAEIYLDNQLIGRIGSIDPRLQEQLNVNTETFVFEVSLQNLSTMNSFLLQNISKFPTIRRDISILILNSIPVGSIIQECKTFFIDQKVEINLFDIYSSNEISNYNYSIGISFVFQDYTKTLIDTEVNHMIENCMAFLKKKFQVILRKEIQDMN